MRPLVALQVALHSTDAAVVSTYSLISQILEMIFVDQYLPCFANDAAILADEL